jgi:hypothetical protein
MNAQKIKSILLLCLTLFLATGCGWFKKSEKSDRRSVKQTAHTDLTPPDRQPIGPSTSGEELALALYNPAMMHACPGQLDNPEYQKLIDALGGVVFASQLSYFRNQSKPYLVVPRGSVEADSGLGNMKSDAMFEESDDDVATKSDAVDIKRADLIGKSGTKVIFLSKTNGLFSVETAGETPTMTCTTIVPGKPKNFYVHDGHLIVINNSVAGNGNGAVMVYQITDGGLVYKAHHLLPNQSILDSRLFNETLVTYGRDSKKMAANRDHNRDNWDEDRSDYSHPSKESTFLVTAFKDLITQPTVTFEDLLRNTSDETTFPQSITQADVGKTTRQDISFKDFVSASDRYLVITKEITETYIERIEQRTRTNRVCTDYNPKAIEVRYNHCAPIWNKVDNPAFDSTFSCHSDSDFASCVQANETKFVKSFWKYKGSTCKEHVYWRGRCLTYDIQTVTTSNPVLKQRTASHLMIYKYENGSFIRFDDPTGKSPISVAGRVKEHKSMQFRDGYFMIITTDEESGTSLSSYKLAEKTIVFAGSADKMGPGEELKAVLFRESEAFVVTFLRKDPLFRIDLADPARPKITSALDVEGFSSQLIAHNDTLIGIGQTAERREDKVKVSLFDADPNSLLSEIDTIALGTDLTRTFNSSATDDQLHHFVPSQDRLYVPYSGMYQKQPSDAFSKVCPVGHHYPKHRLSVLTVSGRLNEVGSFDFRGAIERVQEYEQGQTLAFSTGSVNSLKETNGVFAASTVSELSQIEGIYTDPSLPAGMVVAKQVVRSGGQIYKMSFALGTRDQLIANTPAHVIDLSDDLVSCLGIPQVQFYNNELYIGHNLNHLREGYTNQNDRVEIEITGTLGWRINENGFVPLSADEIQAHAQRRPTHCKIRSEIDPPDTWEELVEHERNHEKWYDCSQDGIGNYGYVINNY